MEIPIDAATAAALWAAAAATAAALISWFILRQQRHADGPVLKGVADLVDDNGPWIYEVRFALDPPGRPPREVREVRIRSPKAVEIAEYSAGPEWGRRVRSDLPGTEGSVFCRTQSPERQILHLELRVGRWSKLSLKLEVADWIEIANRQTGNAGPRETPRQPPTTRAHISTDRS